MSFKDPLKLDKSIKKSSITLGEVKEQQTEFKLELNELVKGSKKSEKQKSVILKHFQRTRKLFVDYSRIASEAKCKSKYGESLKY